MTRGVLVTGAFGYLGLALIRDLSRDHRVVAFGHPPRSPAARRAVPAGVSVVEGDILEPAAALQTHGPFAAIIHLAGGGGPQKCAEDPVAAVRTNVRGTTGLAAAARAAGVPRLLFASTIAVYGTSRVPDGPYRESEPPWPDDLYGALKEAAEHAWTALARGTSLRIANIYGAGSGVDLGIQGAVERFARAAAVGDEMSIYGTGEQRIDYVHIDDVVGAFRRALEAPEGLPAAINVGGGSPVRIADLASACARAGVDLGAQPRITHRPSPAGKSWPDRSLAIDLAASALHWRPQVDLAAGVHGLVRMMKHQEVDG